MGYEQPLKADGELIAKLAVNGIAAKELPGRTPVIVVPEGYRGITPNPLFMEPLPDHIRQKVEIDDAESFVSYVKSFRTHTTRIFATVAENGAKFVAILDYHEGGEQEAPGTTKAGRATHIATFNPAYSPEFAAWSNVNGKMLSQDEFLAHLRRWGGDITSHSDADLIEITSALEFKSQGEYSSIVERCKGGKKLIFNETIEGSAQVRGKSITVPENLTVTLPVFNFGKPYIIESDILYRPQGSLKIAVELKRVHVVIRAAIKDLIADITAATNITPFLGQPK